MLKTFKYEISRPSFEKCINFDVEIPLGEHVEVGQLVGQLLETCEVPTYFFPDLFSALNEFVVEETSKFFDQQMEGELLTGDNWLECDALNLLPFRSPTMSFTKRDSNLKESPLKQTNFPTTGDPTIAQKFQGVLDSGSSSHINQIMGVESRMAHQMSSLVRARDIDLNVATQEFNRSQEANEHFDFASGMALLNQKIQTIYSSYQDQMDALLERQKTEYRRLINQFYREQQQKDEDGKAEENSCEEKFEAPEPSTNFANVVSATVSDSPPSIASHAVQRVQDLSPLDDEGPRKTEEIFTFYIGAQMKTTHNARIFRGDLLFNTGQQQPVDDDVCSKRLQLVMSLYGRKLSAAVVLVKADPLYHIHHRTAFASICERLPELHFDPLDRQLREIQEELLNVNKIRPQNPKEETSRASSSFSKSRNYTTVSADKYGGKSVGDDGLFSPGDVYITTHSNTAIGQIVFHLVVDGDVNCGGGGGGGGEISSRHPCVNALRNIFLLCSRFSVRTLTFPLLLVDTLTESVTNSWCMTRAELLLKCAKGFLIEVCLRGGASQRRDSARLSSLPHYNINFGLPANASDELQRQICELFTTTFHLAPSLNADF